MLTRHVWHNLSKNKLQTSRKLPFANSANTQQPNSLFYSEATTAGGAVATCNKQQLFNFPTFSLEETICKFLKITEPFLIPIEHKRHTEHEAEALAKLQQGCPKEAEKYFMLHRWLRTKNIKYCDPATVFSSPGITFPLQAAFNSDDDYLNYAAKIVFGLMSFKHEYASKSSRDNSQPGFSTCRIPLHSHEDRVEEYFPKSKHIVVIYRNHFYKLNVYARNGKLVHHKMLCKELKKIFLAEKEKEKAIEFGILSTMTTARKAEAYEQLTKSPTNKDSIKCIQAAIFTLSLDDAVSIPAEGSTDYNNVFSEQLIHGGGRTLNSANRWMDKTIQVIVNRNGMSGFIYEHSPAEAQPIALMLDYVIKNFLERREDKISKGATKKRSLCYRAEKLKFESPTPYLEMHMETAKVAIDTYARDLACNVLRYKKYGNEFMKAHNLNAAAFTEVIIEYAFFKLHHVRGAKYEPEHVHIYDEGSQTMRSYPNETFVFIQAMVSNTFTAADHIELLHKAIEAKCQYKAMELQAPTRSGVHQHHDRGGLKQMIIENNLADPEIYIPPAHRKKTKFLLSTTQFASAHDAFMCYGPLTDDGYSCCYNPRPHDIIVAITAWATSKDNNVILFSGALQEAFTEMRDLLNHTELKEGKCGKQRQ